MLAEGWGPEGGAAHRHHREVQQLRAQLPADSHPEKRTRPLRGSEPSQHTQGEPARTEQCPRGECSSADRRPSEPKNPVL